MLRRLFYVGVINVASLTCAAAYKDIKYCLGRRAFEPFFTTKEEAKEWCAHVPLRPPRFIFTLRIIGGHLI
jgi:hypothetical protein